MRGEWCHGVPLQCSSLVGGCRLTSEHCGWSDGVWILCYRCSICRTDYSMCKILRYENMWYAVHTVLNSVLVLAGDVRDMVLVVIN